MFDSILGNLFGNKTEAKRTVSGNVLNRIKKRKLIIQRLKNVDPNNNLKRAGIAKELLSVSRTEGERKAARKFYKDETELNNLKNKIKVSDSINEKLSLARQGKRLAAKKQKEFWENLINKLQKQKQDKASAVVNKEKVLVVTDTGKEQDKEKDKDMENIEEKEDEDIEENKSEKESDNDIEKSEEDGENEEEKNDDDEDEDNDDDENDKEEDDEIGGTLDNDTDDENKNENLI